MKDGGPASKVTGYWLIEWKRFFSVALLRFDDGSAEHFHNHAFNSISWLLSGRLKEEHLADGSYLYHNWFQNHRPGLKPVITKRSTFHRVFSNGTTWVLTFRGPWAKFWNQYSPKDKSYTTLTNGRKRVYEDQDNIIHFPVG